MSKERSRAYPLLHLEASQLATQEILLRLGPGAYNREVIGEVLGHANAFGGPGARKIASLTQFGFLRRAAGLYSPTPLAQSIIAAGESARRDGSLETALRQPPLFRSLLDVYEPQGCIPQHLESILWRQHGITRRASHLASENFTKSAVYAGVLGRDGTFVHKTAAGRIALDEDSESRVHGELRNDRTQTLAFALTGGKIAKMTFPGALNLADMAIIRQQIDLIETQVSKLESNR